MEYIIAALFGFVQGITEFVPVSSSGHLVILHELFPGFEFDDALAFDVALHGGTLIALILFFWKDCMKYIRAWFTSLRTPAAERTDDQRLSWNIIVAIIPAGVIGFFFEDFIEATFRSEWIVIGMLVGVAVLFLIIEYVQKEKFILDLNQVTWKKALVVGCMQVISFIPGTSRSGITIIAGMMTKLKRDVAARFSFLVSIPLVFAASLKKGVDLAIVGVSPGEVPLLIIGMVVAAAIGVLAIKYLIQFLSTRSLKLFAWYRIALAAVLTIVFILF